MEENVRLNEVVRQGTLVSHGLVEAEIRDLPRCLESLRLQFWVASVELQKLVMVVS